MKTQCKEWDRNQLDAGCYHQMELFPWAQQHKYLTKPGSLGNTSRRKTHNFVCSVSKSYIWPWFGCSWKALAWDYRPGQTLELHTFSSWHERWFIGHEVQRILPIFPEMPFNPHKIGCKDGGFVCKVKLVMYRIQIHYIYCPSHCDASM